MGILIKIAQLLASLSILIVLHEGGHYLAARLFKTRVEKFYLFFNPWFSLVKKQIGETEYGIGWLPLGGYVKISGMIDESMDKEQMALPPQPWEFRSKPAWQRLIIMIGGVTVNIVLGYLIFIMIFFKWGTSYLPADQVTNGIFVDSIGMELGLKTGDHILKVDDETFVQYNRRNLINKIVFDEAKSITVQREGQEVTLPITDSHTTLLTGNKAKDAMVFEVRIPCEIGFVDEPTEESWWCKIRKCEPKPESPAFKVGAKVGDKIVAIDNKPINYYDEVSDYLNNYAGKKVDIQYVRDGDTSIYSPTISEDGTFGFLPKGPATFFDYAVQHYNLNEAISKGSNEASSFITNQLKAFGWMFTGKIKAKESLGSFISITEMFPSSWDWRVFWTMTALLSLILGVLNLLPIPALDGGYVMFLIYEVVTGRKPSDKFMEYAVTIGFFILIAFMIYALGLDIFRKF
jgi:regulator of sigma E protease